MLATVPPLMPPPSWGMNVGYAGQALVFFALGAAWLAAIFFGLSGRNPKLEKWATGGLYGAAGACIIAFLFVIVLSVGDQYQFQYIFSHGKHDYELQYKIAGAWAGQEGSILLWTVASAIFTILGFRAAGPYRRWYGLTAGLVTGVLAGILAFESPFALIPQFEGHLFLPPDGQGLPNSLLNYWVVIHPPTIFLGFGSLTALFCFGAAGMLGKDLHGWLPRVRPFALLSTAILGLGLCMGGFWAYETLGWGGFWMWDPVENTSFVPWCAVVAFVHGIFIQSARRKAFLSNAALAGAPFLLFCYGTFMTRSGFLGDTTVHGFAEMDSVALWFLIALLGASVLGYGTLWVRTFKWCKEDENDAVGKTFWNKTIFYQAAIWLLIGFALCTAIGMSVPMLQSAWINSKPLQDWRPQVQKVVEEKVYHQALFWLYPWIMLCVAIAPYLNWKGLKGKDLFNKIANPLAAAVFLTGMLLLWSKNGWAGLAFNPDAPEASINLVGGLNVSRLPWTAFLAFFTFFAMAANLFKLIDNVRKSPKGIGGFVAHFGLATALAGLIVSRGLEQRATVPFRLTGSTEALGQTYSYGGVTHDFNDRRNRVKLKVTGPGGDYIATPGLYFEMGKDGKPSETIWPGIRHNLLYDSYVNLHPPQEENPAATEEQHLQKGQEAKFEDILITYLGLRTEGELGTASAKFFADVRVEQVGESEAITLTQLTDEKTTKLDGALSDGRPVKLVSMDMNTSGGVITIGGIEKPIKVAAGKRLRVGGLIITCLGLRTDSAHDTPMIALDLQIQPVLKSFNVAPEVAIGETGLINTPASVSERYNLTFRPEAADRSAFFTFEDKEPPFVLDVYYKPLVWLVWIGVGIMTLGGLISALYRRISKKGDPAQETHAPESAAQK
jgi:cytochrome c-type biogenesis protein CcmF